MATSVYFDAHNNRNWTSTQNDTVSRIQALSRCKYQSDLDAKMKACNDTWDGYSKRQLEDVEAVLQWFNDSNFYSAHWINNAIQRLLTSVKNKKRRVYERTAQQEANSQQTSTTTKKNVREKETKVEAPKTPAPKKTANVNTDFPIFEEPSFPDTSRDLFTEMLSKGSKMPTV